MNRDEIRAALNEAFDHTGHRVRFVFSDLEVSLAAVGDSAYTVDGH